MESFKKPAIIRLARRAGIKNISEDCYDTIRNLIMFRLTKLLHTSFIINDQTNTKTLMVNDVVEALRLQGKSVCKSTLSNETCPKY
jgi:histone H3/H4